MTQDAGTPRKHLRIVIAVAALLVIVAAGVFALTRGTSTRPRSAQDSSPSRPADPSQPPSMTTSSSASSPTPTSEATPSSGKTRKASPTPQTAPSSTRNAVPFRAPAPFGDGVRARVVSTRPIQAKAAGPGEVDGSAVAFTIALQNNTTKRLNVAAVTVNCYSGTQQTPASAVTGDKRSQPFTGSIPPGATRTATYVFTLARSQQARVRLEITHAALSSTVVFKGSVA